MSRKISRLPWDMVTYQTILANMTAGKVPSDFSRWKSIKNWHREFSKKTGSEATKVTYARNLSKFCHHMEMSPDEIIAMAIDKGYELGQITWAENITDDYFNYMEQELKYARKTCITSYGPIRGFFRSNGIVFIKKTPRSWAETRIQPPNKEDLVIVRKAAGIRGRVAMDMANSLGWRRADLVKIRYKDIKEDFEAGLPRLYVTFKSQKEEIWAANFIGLEGTDSLRVYFEGRIAMGEIITDDTPLIGQEIDPSKPLSPDQFTRLISELGKAVGKHLTPTHFRKKFRTIAEALVGENPTKRMGAWKLSGVGEMYFLPPREQTLKSYKQIETALSIAYKPPDGDTAIEALRSLAKVYGIDPTKVRIGMATDAPNGEVAHLIRAMVEKREEERLALTRLLERSEQ